MEAVGRRIGPRLTPILVVRVATVLASLSLLVQGCGQTQNRGGASPSAPIVRVLLLENRSQVLLSATQPPTLSVGSGPVRRAEISGGATAAVSLAPNGWKIGGVSMGYGELVIDPADEGSAAVDGHAYRGRYRLVPRASGKFDVINDVDVDGYLLGVIAREMFSGWHEEAYRAQAIVARTYALYVARTGSAGASYDLFADTRSQVYGGISAETAKSRAAVDSTLGMVVAYGPAGEERIFKAYFSACCGGVTQSASAAFGDPASEPLSEQSVGNRCAASPRFSWPPVSISKKEITRRLRLWGAGNNSPVKSIGEVSRIDILSTNNLGRPASFAVTDARGYRYRLGCEDLRLGINTDATDGVRLPSSFCQPINDPAAVRFTGGHGFGHGVGLCQWCAQEEAVKGISHEQIILSAFPKAVLVRAY